MPIREPTGRKSPARPLGWSFRKTDLAPGICRRHFIAMQSENPLAADFVKLMNAAAGTLAGMTREARDGARERFKEAMGGLDFVSREEFDAVKDMAAKAREENEALKDRLTALEAKVFGHKGPDAKHTD